MEELVVVVELMRAYAFGGIGTVEFRLECSDTR